MISIKIVCCFKFEHKYLVISFKELLSIFVISIDIELLLNIISLFVLYLPLKYLPIVIFNDGYLLDNSLKIFNIIGKVTKSDSTNISPPYEFVDFFF